MATATAVAASKKIVGVTRSRQNVGHAASAEDKGWLVYVNGKTLYVSSRASAERELSKAGAVSFVDAA